MILTSLATIGMALAAMAPGLIFCRGMSAGTALVVAMAAASLAISLAATALAGVALNAAFGTSLPAWTLLPVSLLLAGTATWVSRGKSWPAIQFEWPAIIPPAAAALYAAYCYSLAFTELPDGALRVHAWYNADWFKHLGHAHALTNYGIPAKDIFAGGMPLHYYWLIYILPGAGAAIGGDVWTAMFVANLFFVSLLFLAFYGVIRAIGLAPAPAALTVLIATVAIGPMGSWLVLLRVGVEGMLAGRIGPDSSPFATLVYFVPQHAFAVSLLFSWAITIIDEAATSRAAARLIAVAGLATLLTISTLFGAVLLSIYGLTELHRRKWKAAPELAAVAAIAGLLVLLLSVVKFGDAQSALQSPALADSSTELSSLGRAILTLAFIVFMNGLPLFLAAYLAAKWKPRSERERTSRDLAILIAVVTVLVGFVMEFVLGTRLALEIRIRIVNLPTISIAIIGGYFFSRCWQLGGRSRLAAIVVPVVLVALAIPGLWLTTTWISLQQDRNATVLSRDDRQALAALQRRSALRDVVWQYPEKPYLSDLQGRDSWSVVFAGRTNVATERATDYAAAYPDIERAYRYFAGEDVPVPPSVDWIYLSRALHPKSYDALAARLERQGSGWVKRDCYPDACIFERDAAR